MKTCIEIYTKDLVGLVKSRLEYIDAIEDEINKIADIVISNREFFLDAKIGQGCLEIVRRYLEKKIVESKEAPELDNF